MRPATTPRQKAAQLPDGDIVRLLSEQHARMHELFDSLLAELTAPGVGSRTHKRAVFDELCALLDVHEAFEQLVLRPATRLAGGDRIADARSREEQLVNAALAQVRGLKVSSPQFDPQVRELRAIVAANATAEEEEEFPLILEAFDETTRVELGRRFFQEDTLDLAQPHSDPVRSVPATSQPHARPAAALTTRVHPAHAR